MPTLILHGYRVPLIWLRLPAAIANDNCARCGQRLCGCSDHDWSGPSAA